MSKLTKLNAKGKAAPPKAKNAAGILQTLEDRPALIWDPRETESMTRAQAEQYIKDLNAKEPGKKWRLPTVDELFALADRTKCNPAIDTKFFPKAKSDWYWSSTPAAASPAVCAWFVHFYYGYAYWSHRDSHAYVRAVSPSQ